MSLAAKAFDEHRKSVDQRVVKTDVITTRSLKQLDLNVDGEIHPDTDKPRGVLSAPWVSCCLPFSTMFSPGASLLVPRTATMQLSFQLGYYRMFGHHGAFGVHSVFRPTLGVTALDSHNSHQPHPRPLQPASTYESAATVGFKHGRTETVRPCTIER